MVADGYPQSWLDSEHVRHFQLDKCHDDGGNTPRGVGALIAVAEQYDGICFLDADNWFEDDHIQQCLSAADTRGEGCDFVIARCRYVRPDGSVIDIEPEPNHVDTSCFFFLRGSYHTIHHWITMPKEVSPICDRIFYAAIKNYTLKAATVEKTTVNYVYTWAPLYIGLGETPPVREKSNPDLGAIRKWIKSLNQRNLDILQRLTGAEFNDGELISDTDKLNSFRGKISRNALCPCGSGAKYKHCHGKSRLES